MEDTEEDEFDQRVKQNTETENNEYDITESKENYVDQHKEGDLVVKEDNKNSTVKQEANKQVTKKMKKGKKILTPWTQDQKTITTSYFKKHILSKKPPKRAECETLIKEHPDVFKNKDWLKIKVFVQNKYRKNLK